jgi:hypothetical protein
MEVIPLYIKTLRKNSWSLLFLSLTAFFLLSGWSSSSIIVSKNDSPVSPSPLTLDQVWHEENQVRLSISNRGIIGHDVWFVSEGGFWPGETDNQYVFGSGLWIGGIADVDGNSNPDTVTVFGYDAAFSTSEFREGRVGQSPLDPLARVFNSSDSTDLAEWPDEFRNPLGDPIVLSQQDLVTIYNDISGNPFGQNRFGIQVNQRSMAFSAKAAGTSVHAIYFIWTVVNVSDSLPDGPYTIEDMYFGHCADIDVGQTGMEDKTSYIPMYIDNGDSVLLNTVVVWDYDFSEIGHVGEVGLVGFTLDEDAVPGSEVNYTFMSNQTLGQPRPDPTRTDDAEMYRILTCFNGACREDSITTDIRYVLSIGPIDLAPGESNIYEGVLFFADPFAQPTRLEMSGDPIRIDPYQQGIANFIQVALEMKQSLEAGIFPSPFTIFRTSRHGNSADTTGPYTIFTAITDSIGLKEVTLHYSTDWGSEFNSVAMSEAGILNYKGDIPGQSSGSTVLYYVEAIDSADVRLTDPLDAPGTTYSFIVEAPSGIGNSDPSGPDVPLSLILQQNYPNPFNPSTTIPFEIPVDIWTTIPVELIVYDIRGRYVRGLIDSELRPGSNKIYWDGRNDKGETVPSGIYFYTMKVGDETFSRKMTLMK